MSARIADPERARQLQMLEAEILAGRGPITVLQRPPRNKASREALRDARDYVREAREWRAEGAEEMVAICMRSARSCRIKARLYRDGFQWKDLRAQIVRGVPWSGIEAAVRGAK